MATITLLQGQNITDAILNSLGDIGAWSDFLDANSFSEWNPSLYSGQILQVPIDANANTDIINALALYPAVNFSVPDIDAQIATLFAELENAPLVPLPTDSIPTVQNVNTSYTYRQNEEFFDGVLNSTGDMANWGTLLQVNSFDTWTPSVYAGFQIQVPTGLSNLNNYRALTTYPANNFSTPDIYSQIDELFNLLANPLPWILYEPDGFWNDENHYFVDSAFWLD
jgi:hypothetical protein